MAPVYRWFLGVVECGMPITKIPLSTLHRSDGRLVGEASTAGLPPGEWPELVVVVYENLEPNVDVNNVYRLERLEAMHEGTEMEQVMAARYVADGLSPLHLIEVTHDTIDAAGAAIEKLVMDDLAELCWDHVSCARVLMNLRDRLDLMADRLLDIDPSLSRGVSGIADGHREHILKDIK